MAATVTPEAALGVVMAHMTRRFAWGADCCTAASDAFQALHGVDPMRGVRGGYRCEMGAMRFALRRGGFAAAVADAVARNGLVTVAEQPGALGLVRADGMFGAALALCVQPGEWAVKSSDGFSIVRSHEMCWGLPCQL